MPNISRGQIVNQNPGQQALEFATQSAQKAASLIQSRKQLDLMEEELRQQKWRDLHNALMTQMEADAKTNQYGWRGAFENFKGSLGALYSAGGMPRNSIQTLFGSIEESGLSPEVLIRASYSDFLTSDLKNLSPYDVQNSIEQQVKKLAIAPTERGYPTITETGERRERVVGEIPQYTDRPSGPPTMARKPVEELSEEERVQQQLERGRIEKQAEGLEEPPIYYTRESLGLEGEPEGRLERKKTVFPEPYRERGAVGRPGIQPTPGEPLVPMVERIVPTKAQREMDESEKRDYRAQLAKRMPEELAKRFADQGLKFSEVAEEWVRTGEITLKQKGQVAQYAGTLKKTVRNPEFASRLREEYQTPDETGVTKLQRVMMNLGRTVLGVGGSPQELYLAGASMANAIMNPQALQARAAEVQAQINKEEWDSNKNTRVTVQFPDGSVQNINFNQFIAYMTIYGQLLHGMAGGAGGMGDENLLDIIKIMNSMEKDAGLDPTNENYPKKKGVLYDQNPIYRVLQDSLNGYIANAIGAVDENGNPITTTDKFPEIGKIQRGIFRGATKFWEAIPFVRQTGSQQTAPTPYPPRTEGGMLETTPEPSEEMKKFQRANPGMFAPGGR